MYNKKTVVFGSGGHAKSVVSTMLAMKYKPIYCVDINNTAKKNEDILGIKVINLNSLNNNNFTSIVIGVGDNNERLKIFKKYNQIYKKEFPNIFHPTATIDPSVKFGVANQVFAGCYLGPYVTIKDCNIINTKSTIEHDSLIGSYNHIAPSSVLLGKVIIGNRNFIGANSTILPNTKVKNNTQISVNSIIKKNITKSNIRVVSFPIK